MDHPQSQDVIDSTLALWILGEILKLGERPAAQVVADRFQTMYRQSFAPYLLYLRGKGLLEYHSSSGVLLLTEIGRDVLLEERKVAQIGGEGLRDKERNKPPNKGQAKNQYTNRDSGQKEHGHSQARAKARNISPNRDREPTTAAATTAAAATATATGTVTTTTASHWLKSTQFRNQDIRKQAKMNSGTGNQPSGKQEISAIHPPLQPQQQTGEADRTEGRSSIRYEKLVALRKAPWGSTHLGRQITLNRSVIVKEYKELFRSFPFQDRDVTIAKIRMAASEYASLQSPHVVGVLDLDLDRSLPCLVLEYAAGGNLTSVLDRGLLPVGDALRILKQIMEALAYAHQRGVLHRNIKPENVLLDEHGVIKVSDFGLSSLLISASSATQKGASKIFQDPTALPYAAPEVLKDPEAASIHTDMYSLGILMYEMLTGKLPGRRSPLPRSLRPEMPEEIDDIFNRLTSENQQERYSSTLQALDDFHSSSGIAIALGAKKAP